MEGVRKGLVIAHANELRLERCLFKVSQAGRNRVLAEKRKNVHAGVVGYVNPGLDCTDCTTMVSYNPYKAGHFFIKTTNEPVYHASKVLMVDRTVLFA